MKKFSLALSAVLASVAATAMAQQTVTPPSPVVTVEKVASPQRGYVCSISPGEITPTPEMWFYEQYRQELQDPTLAVRRKAEFATEQRQRRIAAMKWFGFSNQRPQANPDPVHSSYSPGWASNSFYPYQWSGVGGRPYVVVWREGSASRNY